MKKKGDITDAADLPYDFTCRRVLHLNKKYLSDVQLQRIQ